jgi:hypothetical protein
MRAMAVQALRLRVNRDCREAIKKGALWLCTILVCAIRSLTHDSDRQATIWIL